MLGIGELRGDMVCFVLGANDFLDLLPADGCEDAPPPGLGDVFDGGRFSRTAHKPSYCSLWVSKGGFFQNLFRFLGVEHEITMLGI